MKIYWWKITVVAIFVLAAVITARVFWSRPSESSITESPARANQQQTRQARPRPSAAELYQTALLHKEPGDSAHRDFRLVVACCRQILQEHPDSPQAEKASELLQEVPDLVSTIRILAFFPRKPLTSQPRQRSVSSSLRDGMDNLAVNKKLKARLARITAADKEIKEIPLYHKLG